MIRINTETYRSGHNGTDSKSVDPQGSVGSNPTVSARNHASSRFFRLLAFLFQFCAKPKPLSIASGIQMCVNVRRSPKVAVTKPFLNLLHRNTVCQKKRGTAMPQIVKAHPLQAVDLQKLRKRVGQVVHPHPLAQFVHKYKAIVFIVVAVAADLLIEFLRLFHLQKVFPEAADQRQGTQTGLGLGRLLFNFRLLAIKSNGR